MEGRAVKSPQLETGLCLRQLHSPALEFVEISPTEQNANLK